MAIVKKFNSNQKQKPVTLALMTVEDAKYDKETGKHSVLCETIGNKKPILVTMQDKITTTKEGKKLTYGFATKPVRKLNYQDIDDEDSSLETETKRLKKGVPLEVRGSFAKKENDTTVVNLDGPGGYFRSFFQTPDFYEKTGIEAQYAVNGTYGSLFVKKDEEIKQYSDASDDAFKKDIFDRLNAHEASIKNLLPAIVLLPTDESNQLAGEEKVIYAKTWDSKAKENIKPVESLKNMLKEIDKEVSELKEKGLNSIFVPINSLNYNYGKVDTPQSREKFIEDNSSRYNLSTTDSKAYLELAQQGIFSIGESKDEDKLFYSINGFIAANVTGEKREQQRTLVQATPGIALAEKIGVQVNPEYLQEVSDEISEAMDARKEFLKESKAVKEAKPEEVDTASAAMDEPGM